MKKKRKIVGLAAPRLGGSRKSPVSLRAGSRVAAAALSLFGSAVAVLTVAAQAPVITLQPTNQTVALRGSTVFTAAGTAHPAPYWEWRLNNKYLGQGNSGSGGGDVQTSWVVQNAQLGDAGNYTLFLSNSIGSVTSSVAVLTVLEQAPVFTLWSQGRTAFVGDDLSLIGGAIGNPAPVYQWFFSPQPPGGSNAVFQWTTLHGATNSVLNIPGATTNNSGYYALAAGNRLGSVTNFAVVSVVPRGPLDSWHWRNPLPQANHLRGIAHGNGLFVAAGFSGTLLTSVDATNWSVVQLDSSFKLWSVAFGNGTFVVVGGDGVILSSTDGRHWLRSWTGTANFFSSVIYANNLFVAVAETSGTGDVIMTSADGVNWTARGNPSIYPMRGVAYGNGRFVAVGSSGATATSSDGLDWQPGYNNYAAGLEGITFGNGRFVAAGIDYILTSTDGLNWTNAVIGGAGNPWLFGAAYNNGTFAVVGYDYGTFTGNGTPVAFTSVDGANWARPNLPGQSALYGIASGDGNFVAVGDNGTIISSRDGINWTARTLGATRNLFGTAFSPVMGVGVGDFGTIATSPDGEQWTVRDSGTTNPLSAVAWGRSNFVAVGSAGTILVSSNGLIWTPRNAATNFNLLAVTFGQNRFVAVGGRVNPFDGSTPILSSPDGVNWTSRTSSVYSAHLTSVTYGGGFFVAVSDSGGFAISPDGITWTNGGGLLPYDPSASYTASDAVAYGNGLFVASYYILRNFSGGTYGYLLTSRDGRNWTPAYSQLYQRFYSVAYGGGAFVAMGDPDYAFAVTSLDGVAWTLHPPQSSTYFYNVGYGRSRFVAAGSGGSILQSDPLFAITPLRQTVLAGADAAFNVTSLAAPPLRFQWSFAETNLPGATGSMLTLHNVQTDKAGTYTVAVSNSFGLLETVAAVLAVNRPPAARCADLVVSAEADCRASGSVDSGSFDPDGDPITVAQSPPGPYPLGTNHVVLTVTDTFGASDSCAASVIVVDTRPPLVSCPAGLVLATDVGQCSISNVTFNVTATDNCGNQLPVICSPPSGATFPVGTTTVTCIATNSSGLTNHCSFVVRVSDAERPLLRCPPDLVVTNAHDAWTSVVTFSPVVADNCPGPVTFCSPPAGSAFGIGVNPVTCTSMDAAGNTSHCSFQVIVLPGNKPPVPLIEVSPLARFPGRTNLLVIAPDAPEAVVVLDGSKSYDPDDASFHYSWFEGTNLLSTSVVFTNRLVLGAHIIELFLDDTFPLGTNSASVTVEVISPAEAVGIAIQLVDDSDLPARTQQPLLASLAAAAASFERGNSIAGINQLRAFQNKLQAQVAPFAPARAQELSAAAWLIIDAINGRER